MTRTVPPRASLGTSIETITDAQQFAGLRDQWTALLADSQASGLFLTWEWLHTWWRHCGTGRSLRLLAVRRGDELIGLAPLAVGPRRLTRAGPFRSLEFLGTGSVGSDYLDFIARRGHEADVLAVLAGSLGRQGRALGLSQLARGSALALRLSEPLARAGWTADDRRTDVCPFIRLAGHSWPSYLASVSGHHRNSFKRRWGRLTREFDVQVEAVSTETGRADALATVIGLHLDRWRGRGGSTAFSAPCLRVFHEDFSQLAAARGWLRVLLLRLGGQPVAGIYGLRYGRTFYFYQTGFDPRFAPYGVGQILVGLSIQRAIEEGAEEYDFLHGNERYKFDWAQDVRELAMVTLYPGSLRGALQRQTVAVGEQARRLARRALGEWRPLGSAPQAAGA